MITTERTRIRMLSDVAGSSMPSYGIQGHFSYTAGETPDLHPHLAEAWINSGQAEAVKEEKKAK